MKRAKRRAANRVRRAGRAKKLPENLARAAAYKKPVKRTRAEIMLLVSIVLIMLVLLAFSQYMVKTDLEVVILNQSSSCYSGQEAGSAASWGEGSILMGTTFEIPDPCYKIESIKAFQKGNRIEVAIKTASGGICIQCFGFREAKYELLSPMKEGDLDIYVDVDGVGQYAWLPFSA